MVTEGPEEGRAGGSDPVEPSGLWGMGMVSVMVGLYFPMKVKFQWYIFSHFRMDNVWHLVILEYSMTIPFAPFKTCLSPQKESLPLWEAPHICLTPALVTVVLFLCLWSHLFWMLKRHTISHSLAWSSVLYTQHPRDQIELTVTPNHQAHPDFLIPTSWTTGVSRTPCFVCSVLVLQLVTTSVQLLQATSPLVLCILWGDSKVERQVCIVQPLKCWREQKTCECNGDALDTGHTSSKGILWMFMHNANYETSCAYSGCSGVICRLSYLKDTLKFPCFN